MFKCKINGKSCKHVVGLFDLDYLSVFLEGDGLSAGSLKNYKPHFDKTWRKDEIWPKGKNPLHFGVTPNHKADAPSVFHTAE